MIHQRFFSHQPLNRLETHLFKILMKSPRGQWFNVRTIWRTTLEKSQSPSGKPLWKVVQMTAVTRPSFVRVKLPKKSLQWRHNERDDVSNHGRIDGLLNRLFRRRSKKTSKLRVTGFREGNSPMTGEFPSLRVSNAENVSISWRHHVND